MQDAEKGPSWDSWPGSAKEISHTLLTSFTAGTPNPFSRASSAVKIARLPTSLNPRSDRASEGTGQKNRLWMQIPTSHSKNCSGEHHPFHLQLPLNMKIHSAGDLKASYRNLQTLKQSLHRWLMLRGLSNNAIPVHTAKGALRLACTYQPLNLSNQETYQWFFDLYLKLPWTNQDILSKSCPVTFFRLLLNKSSVTWKRLIPFEHSVAEKQKDPNGEVLICFWEK